jgi:hypothetical protein
MSRYSRRLANKANRMKIRQMKQENRAAATEVRQNVTDYGTREAVRNELMARQDQPHAAIAAHLGVPQWVVDHECQALAQSSRSMCPHPRG